MENRKARNNPPNVPEIIFLMIVTLLFCASAILSLYMKFSPCPSLQKDIGCPNFSQKTVSINDITLRVGLADTPEERSQGLSGCDHVPNDSGLYFVFPSAGIKPFWMKDMLVPIDIVWINNNKVIKVDSFVSPPSPRSQSSLKTYLPPEPIDAVLELPAGQADVYNIKTGTEIILKDE